MDGLETVQILEHIYDCSINNWWVVVLMKMQYTSYLFHFIFCLDENFHQVLEYSV